MLVHFVNSVCYVYSTAYGIVLYLRGDNPLYLVGRPKKGQENLLKIHSCAQTSNTRGLTACIIRRASETLDSVT